MGRFPRTRGDGPSAESDRRPRLTFPPHARGWTLSASFAHSTGTVSPARAGMDPHATARSRPGPRFPRTRGDGPFSSRRAFFSAAFPPHARGWTLPAPGRGARLPVSPARAGMDPSCPWARCAASRFPRTRGDGPDRGAAIDPPRWFPPHARGWTVASSSRARDRTVSPARAGMDPGDRRRGLGVRRFPRTRGDGPELLPHPCGPTMFPPHARGWTRDTGVRVDRRTVSPARAGMDSNRPVGESGRVFGDDVVATAILERLLHHSHLITICGEATGFARRVVAASSGAPPASFPPPPSAQR